MWMLVVLSSWKHMFGFIGKKYRLTSCDSEHQMHDVLGGSWLIFLVSRLPNVNSKNFNVHKTQMACNSNYKIKLDCPFIKRHSPEIHCQYSLLLRLASHTEALPELIHLLIDFTQMANAFPSPGEDRIIFFWRETDNWNKTLTIASNEGDRREHSGKFP